MIVVIVIFVIVNVVIVTHTKDETRHIFAKVLNSFLCGGDCCNGGKQSVHLLHRLCTIQMYICLTSMFSFKDKDNPEGHYFHFPGLATPELFEHISDKRRGLYLFATTSWTLSSALCWDKFFIYTYLFVYMELKSRFRNYELALSISGTATWLILN